MVLVLEDLREVVTQCVCVTILCSEMVRIKICRLILDCSCITYIVSGKAVESVVLLAIVVKTTFYLEVEVVDDMPCNCTVDSPVLTNSATVIVSY